VDIISFRSADVYITCYIIAVAVGVCSVVDDYVDVVVVVVVNGIVMRVRS